MRLGKLLPGLKIASVSPPAVDGFVLFGFGGDDGLPF